MTEHVKTPYKITKHYRDKTDTIISGEYDYMIADCSSAWDNAQNESNTKFIVKACNNYEDLIKAINGLISACYMELPDEKLKKDAYDFAKEVYTRCEENINP